jgi:hypothetical protein
MSLVPDSQNGDVVRILKHFTGFSGYRKKDPRKGSNNVRSSNVKDVISVL